MITPDRKYVTFALKSGEIDRKGYDAMRAHAQWHLGATEWANDLMAAYLNPERTLALLEADGMDTSDFKGE